MRVSPDLFINRLDQNAVSRILPARLEAVLVFPAIRLPSPATPEIVDFVALTLFSKKFAATEAEYSVARFLTTRFIKEMNSVQHQIPQQSR